MRRLSVIIALTATTLISEGAFAADGNATVSIQKVALFKNGLGFITSRATLPQDAQSIRIGQLPIPKFGTFWVGYPKQVKLENLVTSMETLEGKAAVQSVGQMVQANVGRRVTLHMTDKDIEGVVLAAPVGDTIPDTPSPYVMGSAADRNVSYVQPSGRAVLMIKTDRGIVALDPNAVTRAEFADGSPVTTVPSTKKLPAIRLTLQKPAGGEKITISYLARGVTWAPGYLIDLSDAKTARVSAHAVIVNELTDLDNVALDLVTGFPNMKFSNISSPVAKSQSLADFLHALSGGVGPREESAIMNQIVVTGGRELYDDNEALVPAYSSAAEGVVAEDLFFYPVKNFSLKFNETAWVPLFTADMSYKHIYTWNIPDVIDENDRYRPQQNPQERPKGEEVWHSCRLVNSLDMPLTTASAEFTSNGEFTGQDICYYTPPHGETTIHINKALNVIAEQAEVEIDRKRDAAVFYGYHYDLVKVEGDLKIRNKIDKTINLEISKALSGDVLESSPKADDTKTAKGLKKVNAQHLLKWVIALKPGEEKKVSYHYQVYFRE